MRCSGIDLAWSPRNFSGGFALEIEEGTVHEIGWREGSHPGAHPTRPAPASRASAGRGVTTH
jgi:hypothetical protein